MSILDYSVPLRNTPSADIGNYWGSDQPDYQLSLSPTTLEAQALSSLFSLDTTDIFQGQSEGGQPRRREGDRKRKMSSREDPWREQQPKRRRETEPYNGPQQYVAPHELTTSPADGQSYAPLSMPRPTNNNNMRRPSAPSPMYDQRRPAESPQTYAHGQYLQTPTESDWSKSPHSPERPLLPSISSTPYATSSQMSTSVAQTSAVILYPQAKVSSSRPPTSYSMSSIPSIPTGYAPVMAQSPYRHSSLSYLPTESNPQGSQYGMPVHASLASGSEQDTEDRGKPRCWDHGCNGKQFSTFSNLLRHQRERAGTSAKSYCPRCGAEFTRTTARNGHVAHAKCKPRRSPDPHSGPGSAS